MLKIWSSKWRDSEDLVSRAAKPRRAVASLLFVLAGCAADTSDMPPAAEPVAPITGLSSGASCPPMSSLTYDGFGETFFATYCLQCHTIAIPTGPSRQAPPNRNFDDLTEIRALAHEIDQQAAAGPSGAHQVMPPLDPKPTLQQRMQLGEWLACGAP
jgi:uncharacterized membrane protein